MVISRSKKFILCAAAAATTLSVGTSAFAGGGYYGGHGGFYGGGHGGYYSGGHGYGYGHGYSYGGGHHGGGKAAAIALGVIGGAIIVNELAENKYRRRAYEDRYDRRYDRYSRRAVRTYDTGAFERGYEEGYARGRDGGDGAPAGDDLDVQLEGSADGGPQPIRLTYDNAYKTCTKHARVALGNRGFILAAPNRPETAEDLGGSWKMTANVTAQNQNGESWTRAMYCEADDSRVYLLELI
jgi:hypothetical protein